MFPIKDFKSNIIAFGGRDLENSNIKYINSSDSPIFKKSYQLFGLDIAIEENRKIKDLIIVEGYMDVVALYQNNFKNTVAPLGTALTSTQLERAWKVCENPIIMFDGDEAGQKASYRAAILALSYLLPDLSLRFCILPKDYDPDDFMQNWGANDMKITIEKSLSLSEFIWEQELKKEDISTPEKKAGFEKRIFDITKKINNQTVRDYYIKFFKEKLSKKYHSNQSSYISLNRINNKISKEVILSDRANYETHDSVVREKIIILSLLENPFLASKHIEELGKIPFNDLKLSSLIANILEIFASRVDKELENFNLKSYLLDKGLAQEIDYIYQPKLLDTYSSIINNDEDSVEKGFQGLLQLHKNLIEGNDLKVALTDLEEKMDEQSFENFMKIKKESLNNN